MPHRGKPSPWGKLYNSPRWGRLRRHQLLSHPMCKFCLEWGIVELATVVDRRSTRTDLSIFGPSCVGSLRV
jgi:hypothetical protein